MTGLTHSDLYSLEQYARIRNSFRDQVMTHKRHRRLPLGEHAALYFEDKLTMQYQVQEMLRIERIFEPEGIQEELDVYNPLIPDGSNWKATFMIEYSDEQERRAALAQLTGIEKQLFIRIGDQPPVYAIANEDLERETEDKTSAVHFVRFELSPLMVDEAKAGASIKAGIEHPHCQTVSEIIEPIRSSLIDDLK